MEREANYITVGAFVLLVIALGTAFVIWYSDRGDKRDYQRYEIYFNGSVSGLSEGSPVRYLGVDVGRVVEMNLDPRTPDRVQVLADIDEDAPVSEETLASLSLQGVTGLLYIDLERDKGNRPVMPRVPSQRGYQVIRSVQSDFDLLIASIPELFTQASSLAARVSDAFSDENIAAAQTTLQNVALASEELAPTLREARQLIADLRRTAGEIEAAAVGVRDVTDSAGPDVKLALERVRTVADNLAATSARLESFVAENQANIARFSDSGLKDLEYLIRDSRQAAQEFRELTRSLRNNPSQLIYEQSYPGVEIQR
jgi:phospholipid/cholesterol/gamma-HCH transport system substrate-binding protein